MSADDDIRNILLSKGLYWATDPVIHFLSAYITLRKLGPILSQNKSEAREPEGLVKITYGIVASSLFKTAGNSN